ncbi:MAG: polysaccharide pyruvyl transferase family protein, partial [Duncaniella sp.]|nr:polysaccharide pyruvyl transferase family protein [Duncaniella sp.]
MKIGILTQPLQRNYGGIIQNWALQEVLRRMGHEAEMIFRQPDAPRPRLGLTILRCCSLLKCIIYKILLGRRDVVLRNPLDNTYNPRQPRYADGKFIKRIQRSRICHSDRELREIVKKNSYDAFIVGSDQVWRQEYSPRIETYFLDFLSDGDRRKKVAYAASFGVETGYIDADKMQQCKTLLSRFDAVSVREDGGLRIVREDFSWHDVEKVLDPTLLLSDSDYRCLIKASDCLAGEKYITSYILDDSMEKQRIVHD